MIRVGIVGGGPAGAICARVLADRGVDVTVVDKGRRAGGRLSTRTYDEVHFDHGAQFMTVRDEIVRRRLDAWRDAGVLAPWDGREEVFGDATDEPLLRRKEQRWVGTPGMSDFVAHLLGDIPCHFSTKATRLQSVDGLIELHIENQDVMRFDRVVLAVPAPQAVPLLQDWPRLASQAKSISYYPCWAVMAEFSKPFPGDWISAVARNAPVRWIGRNQTKPGRPSAEAWVIHATPEWTRSHLEETREAVAETLMDCAQKITKWAQPPNSLRAHRWRYALVEQPLGTPYLYDAGMGLCGDGLLGGRIERALLSGVAMAERVLQSRSDDLPER
jgi:renalase